MDWHRLGSWLASANLGVVALWLFVAMFLGATLGGFIRARRDRVKRDAGDDESNHEGYMVSGVLGLMALLTGFTFSLAVDRFETRRVLVLTEANAIGTTYLRAQLLSAPHRARMSDILVHYTDNRLLLAKASPGSSDQKRLLDVNDGLIVDMWAATSAAFETIKGIDFSSTYVDSVNTVIDLDASRKAARMARVPPEVFALLFVYMVASAGVLGYVLRGRRGRVAAVFLMGLTTLSLVLIIDIDRPVLGGIVEGQVPMEQLQKFLKAQPASVFDRWKGPATALPGPTKP